MNITWEPPAVPARFTSEDLHHTLRSRVHRVQDAHTGARYELTSHHPIQPKTIPPLVRTSAH